MVEKQSQRMTQLSSTLSSFYSRPVAKISIELFLSFGLVIILVIVAIQPTLTTIAKLNTEIAEKKELTSVLASKISAVTTAVDLYSQYRSKISLLDESLPPTANLITTLKIVEKLAGESNVVISAMSVSQVPDETTTLPTDTVTTLTSLPVAVTVMGQYQDMRRFVEALHASRRTIQVLSASFSLEDTRGQRVLMASFVLDAPYYGVPAAIVE